MTLGRAEASLNSRATRPDLQYKSNLNLLYRETMEEIGNVSITVYKERASLQQD